MDVFRDADQGCSPEPGMEEHHQHHPHWPALDHGNPIHGYIPVDPAKLEYHMKHEGVKMEPVDHVTGIKHEHVTGLSATHEQYQSWIHHHYGSIPQYTPQYHPHQQLEVPHHAIGFA